MILMRHFLIAQLLLICLVPSVASAETVLRTGESVSVETNQVIEDDFYVGAGTVSMSGKVSEDMYAVAGSATINGEVGKDLTILAGSAQVHASTSDDVRVVAGEVVIAERVGGDVFVIGGLLKILSSATVAGNVFFYGGEAEINGAVGGSVLGTADRIRIDTTVDGDVDVTTAYSLTLGDRANISGDVRYVSADEIIRAQNAVVEGEVVRNTESTQPSRLSLGDRLLPLFVLLFATLSFYLIFRRELLFVTKETFDSVAKAGLVGAGVLLGGPLIVLLLFVTQLGVLVGLILLLALLLGFTLSLVLMNVLAGNLAARLFSRRAEMNVWWIFLGTAIVDILIFIPIVGPFILFVLFTITLGGLVFSTYRLLR